MRLCTVRGEKAMFHCWEQVSITAPKTSSDDKQSGITRYSLAIVEFANGRIERVTPEELIFLDSQKQMQRAEKEVERWNRKHIGSSDSTTSSNEPIDAVTADGLVSVRDQEQKLQKEIDKLSDSIDSAEEDENEKNIPKKEKSRLSGIFSKRFV